MPTTITPTTKLEELVVLPEEDPVRLFDLKEEDAERFSFLFEGLFLGARTARQVSVYEKGEYGRGWAHVDFGEAVTLFWVKYIKGTRILTVSLRNSNGQMTSGQAYSLDSRIRFAFLKDRRDQGRMIRGVYLSTGNYANPWVRFKEIVYVADTPSTEW